MDGRIILLSGPLGAGKTSVSRELAKTAVEEGVQIEGDDFWKFMPEPPQGSSRRDFFPILIRSMIAASIPFARSKFEVIVDFTIPPQALPTARKIVKELPLHWVVIRPPVETCAARAAARKPGTVKDYGPYRELYAMFADVPDEHLFAEEASAAVLAKAIRRRIESGETRID